MRLASVLLAMSIFGVPSIATPVHAFEFGTRDDAMAMVRRVQEKFKNDGPEATFKAINSKAFVDRDLFPSVYRLNDGTNMANAMSPDLRGKQLIDLRDQDGKFITQEWIRIATTQPYHGWSDYRWLNPITHMVDDTSTYIERMGEYVVGVGIHKNEQPNENTVGVISGSPNSDDTYLQIATDLAEVLNDSDNLHVLPIVGIGGPRNIHDVRYMRGVDIGLTQTNALNEFRRSNERMGQVDNRITYITMLFNEEVHLIAKSNINSIEQLRGRKVNFDAKGSGTSYSMLDLFKRLEIDVEVVSMSQVEALEKVKSDEIAATALIAGDPVRSISRLTRQDGLHFLAIPYPKQLIGDYLPATLNHDDYPEVITDGDTVNTVAVGAVLITYNWPKSGVDRYGRVKRFVDAFFPKITEFQRPPHHPKWREVNIAANLPGWTRFEPAQAWLDSQDHQDDAGHRPRTPATGQATQRGQVARRP